MNLKLLVAFFSTTSLLPSCSSYVEPHNTTIYCSSEAGVNVYALQLVLKREAELIGLTMIDQSDRVASDLDALSSPRPNEVLYGEIRKNGDLVATFSNLGTDERAIHVSFYSRTYYERYKVIIEGFENAMKPNSIHLVPGGEFNKTICG